MQQETETRQGNDGEASGPRLIDELKGYAAEHRALWEKNYRAFTDEYGHPRDRLLAMRDRMTEVYARLKEQARVGYSKVDAEIARKSKDAETVSVNGGSTNGKSPEAEPASKSA